MGAEALVFTTVADRVEVRQASRRLQHDVRSPLSVIRLAAECLEYLAGLDLATRRCYAASISVQAGRIGRLLDYFAAVSDEGRDEVAGATDLLEALQEAAGQLGELTRLLQITLRVGPTASGVRLQAPAKRLRLVLVASLEAACELTREGGEVVASLRERGKGTEVNLHVSPWTGSSARGESLVWQAAGKLAESEPLLVVKREREVELRLALPWERVAKTRGETG